MNARVNAVLTAVTNEESQGPVAWWEWWNRHTDVEIVKEIEEVEQQAVAERVPFHVQTLYRGCSCFKAGTLVLTERGQQAIERIRVGDRVLSQDIETGELSLKMVERTTVRKPRATVSLHFGDDNIVCTGGHQFWLSGDGWARARDLQVGDRIRTTTGTKVVSKTESAPPMETYNLVVSGSHTYFVGESGLLVQDLLPPRPTDMVLPGLSRFELEE